MNVTSNLGVGRGDGKIVDLSAKKDMNTLDSGMADVLIVGGRLKTKFGVVQDGVDVFLPKTTSFRVSLQA